eukprot:324576-Ditylum_brightwellii.AAC.1
MMRHIFDKQSQPVISARNEPCVGSSQPGGTMTDAAGKHMRRIIDADSDRSRKGRWSWVCLDGNNTKLCIIMAYRVTQEVSDGTNTAHIQQTKIMWMKGNNNPIPRKQWITDMIKQLNTWKKQEK